MPKMLIILQHVSRLIHQLSLWPREEKLSKPPPFIKPDVSSLLKTPPTSRGSFAASSLIGLDCNSLPFHKDSSETPLRIHLSSPHDVKSPLILSFHFLIFFLNIAMWGERARKRGD